MPGDARWFAGSAEGLAEAYAAAGRPPRAEGPRRSCLGVRVRRVARKGRFAPRRPAFMRGALKASVVYEYSVDSLQPHEPRACRPP